MGLREKMQQMKQMVGMETTPLDLNQFGDPLATEIEWTPAKSGGTNIKTHKMVQVEPNRIEFRATFQAKFFYGLFFVIGCIALCVGVGVVANGQWGGLIAVLVGLVFALVGAGLFISGTAPIVFDTQRGLYWRGRKSPEHVVDRSRVKDLTELEQVHALQILRERCSGDKKSYYSYELNLVLEDGSRVNVTDHGDLSALRNDAQQLSQLLGKPIWDGA